MKPEIVSYVAAAGAAATATFVLAKMFHHTELVTLQRQVCLYCYLHDIVVFLQRRALSACRHIDHHLAVRNNKSPQHVCHHSLPSLKTMLPSW